MKQPKKKYSFTTKGISGDVAGDFAKKTGETVENLPQFNFRGKDAYKGSLSKGPNAKPQVSFTKGEDKKLPYLSSRFKTVQGGRTSNMKQGGADDRSQTYSGPRAGGTGSNSNARTISEDNLNREQARVKQSIQGTPDYLKSQEKAAKESSKIGQNLQSAMSSGDETTLKNAVTQANTSTLAGSYNLKRDPGKVTNDASFQNRSMIDAFDTARKDASGAQDLVDFNRGLKGRMSDLFKDLKTSSDAFNPPTTNERSGVRTISTPTRTAPSSQNRTQARVQEDFD
jgi:hypothetical protein